MRTKEIELKMVPRRGGATEITSPEKHKGPAYILWAHNWTLYQIITYAVLIWKLDINPETAKDMVWGLDVEETWQ